MAAVNVSYNSTDIAGTLTERTDSSEEQTKVVEQMIMKITDKAAKSLENTTYTKEEALVLEREIEEALNSTQSKQSTTWFNVGSASEPALLPESIDTREIEPSCEVSCIAM